MELRHTAAPEGENRVSQQSVVVIVDATMQFNEGIFSPEQDVVTPASCVAPMGVCHYHRETGVLQGHNPPVYGNSREQNIEVAGGAKMRVGVVHIAGRPSLEGHPWGQAGVRQNRACFPGSTLPLQKLGHGHGELSTLGEAFLDAPKNARHRARKVVEVIGCERRRAPAIQERTEGLGGHVGGRGEGRGNAREGKGEVGCQWLVRGSRRGRLGHGDGAGEAAAGAG
jgi:hypothetical protein